GHHVAELGLSGDPKGDVDRQRLPDFERDRSPDHRFESAELDFEAVFSGNESTDAVGAFLVRDAVDADARIFVDDLDPGARHGAATGILHDYSDDARSALSQRESRPPQGQRE